MIVNWAHAWPPAIAAFLASLVEFVEALTVVLAVGAVRGWSGALIGSGAALGVLLAIVVATGSGAHAYPAGCRPARRRTASAPLRNAMAAQGNPAFGRSYSFA